MEAKGGTLSGRHGPSFRAGLEHRWGVLVGAERTAVTKDGDFKRMVRVRMARTGESYTTARASLRPPIRARADADTVLRVVADHFGLDPDEIVGRDRRPPRPEARAAAMYLLVNDAGLRPAVVGAALGGRSPDTVRRAVARVASAVTRLGTAAQLATLRDGALASVGSEPAGVVDVPDWLEPVRHAGNGGGAEATAQRLANLAMRVADGKTQNGEIAPAAFLADRAGSDPLLLAVAWLTCRDVARDNPRDMVARAAMNLLAAAVDALGSPFRLPTIGMGRADALV